MKTLRLCVGLISIFLCFVILFQSCATGLGEALSGEESGGSGAGMIVAFVMMIAGIVGACTRKSAIGGVITAIFYALGGISGVTANTAIFKDLMIWGVVCFVFAGIFLLGALMTKKSK